MVNKKYLLLAGFCALFAMPSMQAQESDSAAAKWSGRDMTYRGQNYDQLDSSYYRGKRLAQFKSYMEHQTSFCPMPNNMWEFGFTYGLSNVFGDVTSFTAFSKNLAGHGGPSQATGWGFTVRKSLGYFLSVRFQYINAKATGIDYRPHLANEAPWNQNSFAGFQYPVGSYIYNNYRTSIGEGTIQLVGALNNIRFHKPTNKLSLYGFIGVGMMAFTPKVNAFDKNGKPFPFAPNELMGWNGIPGYPGKTAPITWADRKQVYDAIYALWSLYDDDSYESNPTKSSATGSRERNTQIVMTTGFGLQYRLNNRFTFQMEEKMSFTGSDLLDGTQKESNTSASNTANNDIFNYGSVGLNYNFGNKRKNVAPLWWINPLDHTMNEMSDPRHMRLPDPTLPDNDNDGIPDQFDKCPGSPVGVPVDAHGCPLDTDGDGVPDFRDKELITPTICQPVDADGVGKCPCPDGCEGKKTETTPATHCNNITFGSLTFSGNKAEVAPTLRNQLANLASQMKANPTCKVVIIGNGNETKKQQQRSWDRVNAIINFLSDVHGIDRNRIIFQYAGSGDANTVMFRSANEGEDGPSNVAPPFPNLRQE